MKKENMIFRLKMEIASLVNDMVAKLPDELFSSDSTTFLDPSVGGGQYVSAIEQRLRKHGHTDENIKNRVFGVEKNMLRVNYAIKKNKLVGTYSIDKDDIPSILIGNMKFDCIVGNPPYQKRVGNSNTEPLWHTFVESSIKSLKDGGYLCYVHPSGWRDVAGRFKGIGNLMTGKDIQYLELHSKTDGNKTFGASTPYDWYVLKNVENQNHTEVKFQDGITKILDLKTLKFIPNGAFDKLEKLLAKNGEESCKIISDYTYPHRASHVSKEKKKGFSKPLIYTIHSGDKPTFLYTSENRGHFGVPKVIWSNGGITMGMLVDSTGEYGLAEYAFAIVDNAKNLDNIKKAMTSVDFKKMIVESTTDGSISWRVMALFRKDFYKDFL